MPQTRDGFSLLELLGVLLICSILIGLGAAAGQEAVRRGRKSSARAELEQIRLALEAYRAEFDSYPAQFPEGPLKHLPQVGLLADQMTHMPLTDPWGRDYHYTHQPDGPRRFCYRLRSLGPDIHDATDDLTLPVPPEVP